MIELPAVSWDVGAVELLAGVVMFFVGYATHEAMHLGALIALREPYSVDLFPDGLRGFLVAGDGVSIQFERMAERWRVAVVMLAPLVAAGPPLVAWAMALSYPVVDAGVALVLGLWFIAAIPGLHDVLTVATYDPGERVPTEVVG